MRQSPTLRITNLWTPAHIGTVGNEFADDAVKAATLLPPPSTIPVSFTTVKRAVSIQILERWEWLWSVATTGRGLRDVDNSAPSLILRSPYLSSAACADISILTQLRTDFSALNAHRFRCRLAPSPACEACGAPWETRAHFLLHCPAWEYLRPPLQLASFKAGVLGSIDVRMLLNHLKLLKLVISFIAQMHRFCS
ncbi:reverse transcriptase [Mycena venus]|uniref:Reverse transcriptase n=1 Tax=Mycena venus TaxID=2733690 RepID=A0A8H6Z4B6_9AGAR|nr:reverse transcriptase [Mycena venus]